MSTMQNAGPPPSRGAGSPACGLALLAVWPIVEGGVPLEDSVAEAAWCLERGEIDVIDVDGHPITVDQVRTVGDVTWRTMTGAELAAEVPGSGWEHSPARLLVATIPAVRIEPDWRRRRAVARTTGAMEAAA